MSKGLPIGQKVRQKIKRLVKRSRPKGQKAKGTSKEAKIGTEITLKS